MSKFSQSITFVLFTFNEEKRVERAILNFRNYGKILIVDNDSTDRTRDIAAHYGCDILLNKNSGWVEDEVTTSRVKATVTTDWIYWGFADEMVEAATIQAILAAVDSGQFDIVNIARKNYYYGQFCHDVFADRMNRIFKKDAINFAGNKIHGFGSAMAGARICELPSDHFVHHFISNTAKSYLQTMDRYTDMEGSEDRNVKLMRLTLSTGKTVAVNFLFRGGYRSGLPGAFLICQTAYYRWLAAMKIYEKSTGLDRNAIELKNDAVRDRILQSLQ